MAARESTEIWGEQMCAARHLRPGCCVAGDPWSWDCGGPPRVGAATEASGRARRRGRPRRGGGLRGDGGSGRPARPDHGVRRRPLLAAAGHGPLELTRFRAQVMAFAGAGAVSGRSSPGRPAAVGWLEPLDDRGPRIDQSERGVEPRHRDVRVRRHCGRRRRAGADRGATRDAAPYDADV